jgi:gliding motility-associated-like protein
VLCNDDSTTAFAINSLSDYSDSIFYFWYPDTLILSQQGLDSAVLLVDSNVLNYYVVALNEYGCYDTASFVIEIQNNSPILNIQASPDSIFVGQTSQLLATDSIDYTYNWWPDSSLSANQIFNPEASPDIETTYYLSVQNLLGCVTMDSVVIYILDPICGLPTVYIPNAFSPDGDGYNDIHYINGNNINQIYFQVFDRWGNKVFESRDQNVGWDGKLNGSELAPDVYGYFLECTCDDGSTLKTKGNISLIR